MHSFERDIKTDTEKRNYPYDKHQKGFLLLFADLSEESAKMMHADMDGEMPVLCVRDSVLFPGTMTPGR